MKFKNLVFILIALTTVFSSCNDDTVEIIGNWVTKAYFGGHPRTEGTSFSIGGYGYFGLGKDGDEYLSDFYKYDPVKNTWTQLADFQGTPRAYNISANTDTKGYMGLGYDGDNDLEDFWEYDPITDKWDSLTNFPNGARRHAASFVIGNDVYVGTGCMDNNKVDMNDFWKYSNGSWSAVAPCSGQKRRESNAIGYNGKGYIISGITRSGIVLTDFWSYDPTTDTWSELDKLTDEDTGDDAGGIQRYNAATFVVDSKIYLATGSNSTKLNTVWEWNPSNLIWTEKTAFEGANREGAGSFVLAGNAYIVAGYNGSYMDDCYLFQPAAEKDADD